MNGPVNGRGLRRRNIRGSKNCDSSVNGGGPSSRDRGQLYLSQDK